MSRATKRQLLEAVRAQNLHDRMNRLQDDVRGAIIALTELAKIEGGDSQAEQIAGAMAEALERSKCTKLGTQATGGSTRVLLDAVPRMRRVLRGTREARANTTDRDRNRGMHMRARGLSRAHAEDEQGERIRQTSTRRVPGGWIQGHSVPHQRGRVVIIVGCDPHTRTPAFGVTTTASKEMRVFKLGRPGHKVEEMEIRREITATLAHYRDGKPAHFIAEDQFIGTGRFGSARAGLMLTRARQAIEIAAQDAGLIVHPAVHPATWRSKMLGISSANPNRHELALRFVRRVLGLEDLDDVDMAEAAIMALYLKHRVEFDAALNQRGIGI